MNIELDPKRFIVGKDWRELKKKLDEQERELVSQPPGSKAIEIAYVHNTYRANINCPKCDKAGIFTMECGTKTHAECACGWSSFIITKIPKED
jgi:peptide methionine sulfoxide reductase MsrB